MIEFLYKPIRMLVTQLNLLRDKLVQLHAYLSWCKMKKIFK